MKKIVIEPYENLFKSLIQKSILEPEFHKIVVSKELAAEIIYLPLFIINDFYSKKFFSTPENRGQHVALGRFSMIGIQEDVLVYVDLRDELKPSEYFIL